MKNERVLLRALEPSDIDFIYQLENDISVWHVSNTIAPFSRYAIEQYVLNSDQDIFTLKQLRLIIESSDVAPSKRIGTIDVFDFDPQHKRAGIGIIIIEEEQHKGYALEAMKLVVDYCFKTLGLHQIFCNISAENQVSINLFEKMGFTNCGVKKEWILYNDSWQDELIFQLINK